MHQNGAKKCTAPYQPGNFADNGTAEWSSQSRDERTNCAEHKLIRSKKRDEIDDQCDPTDYLKIFDRISQFN